MHRQDELDFLTYLVTDSYALSEYNDVLKAYQFRDENCKQLFLLLNAVYQSTGEVPTHNECSWAIRNSVQAQKGDWSPLEVQSKLSDVDTVYTQDITLSTAHRVQTWVAERDFEYLAEQMSVHEPTSMEKLRSQLTSYRQKLDKLDDFLNPMESEAISFPLFGEEIEQIPDRMGRMFSGDVVPLPWAPINNLAGGGGHKKEVSLFLGLPNRGKSTVLTNVSCYAALEEDMTVVHYNLDDSPMQMYGRIYAHVSGVAIQGVELNELKSRVAMQLQEKRAKLVLRNMPRATLSPAGLARDLERVQNALEERGLSPEIDLVVIDYLDEMKAPDGSGKELRHRLVGSMRGLGRIAGEMNVHITVGTQSNAKALGQPIVGARNLSEAFGKLFVPKLCIGICVTDSQMHRGKMGLGVFKNTWGPNNMLLSCDVDWARQKVTAVPGANMVPVLDGGDNPGGGEKVKKKPLTKRELAGFRGDR